MKKTIAVIGSAAALSFAGAGLAAAADGVDDQDQTPDAGQVETTEGEDTESTPKDPEDQITPEVVSGIAEQLCGTISAYDFLGSTEGIVPGLSGEECETNADAAVAAAMAGDISGALDILRGIDAGTPGEGDGEDADDATGGSAQLLGSLTGGGDDTEDPQAAAFGS